MKSIGVKLNALKVKPLYQNLYYNLQDRKEKTSHHLSITHKVY